MTLEGISFFPYKEFVACFLFRPEGPLRFLKPCEVPGDPLVFLKEYALKRLLLFFPIAPFLSNG